MVLGNLWQLSALLALPVIVSEWMALTSLRQSSSSSGNGMGRPDLLVAWAVTLDVRLPDDSMYLLLLTWLLALLLRDPTGTMPHFVSL